MGNFCIYFLLGSPIEPNELMSVNHVCGIDRIPTIYNFLINID